MPVVRHTGRLPASIAEGSAPGDWVANLGLSGDVAHLVAVEAAGPMAAFFSVSWSPGLGTATIRPAARLDFEAFSAAGTLPAVQLGLAFVFNDGSRQEDWTLTPVAVLDRDDTPPAALAFSGGGTVAAGAIGAAIGTLSVADPDSAGPFFFSFTWEDEWRFEVVDGVLKLRDGISLGWDDMPTRPVLVQVSDGTQSAAFMLDIAVTAPEYGPAPYVPPALAAGESRSGFVLAGPQEALTTRPAEQVTAITTQPGDLGQILLDTGESVWTGPAVERVRFVDGWLAPAGEGPAARAAALHRAVVGKDADGIDLAPLVASLRAGAGWADVADHLLNAAPALAALDDAAFVRALGQAALGAAPATEAVALHAGRLVNGATTRAQVVVDLALSPEALARLAADSPAGHWVADPFDEASDQHPRPSFGDAVPASVPWVSTGSLWFA